MKYTLKNYQEKAVTELVETLDSAAMTYRATRNRPRPSRSAVSLAAVTGAGKTVMAAAMIERVYKGTSTTPADPTATFLWVSDSPDLNTQSRHRIEAALGPSRTIKTRAVTNDFREEKLQPGTLYFINNQKLSKTATLARRHYRERDEMNALLPVPDAGDYDFWQTLETTLNDEHTTLYLIVDEAHRGMKSSTSDRSTIIQRIIGGSGDTPPVPLVVGISATPGRFRDFMAEAQAFSSLPEVTVDAQMVQESGLLKDTILLTIPDEDGDYDHALLTRGTNKLREVTAAWDAYTARSGTGESVVPLMLVQVEDKASDELIDSYVETIRNAYPELTMNNFAHVLGEDRPIKAGATDIHRVEPERVQETTRIRVLFAKEAISTGWDCPRAEVMVSFRPAKDHTHITQLMGRMVRTPLARRIDGDDVLSSVTCILPKFDREVAESVAETVGQGGTDWVKKKGEVQLRRVLIDPETVYPADSSDAQRMWELFAQLPTETIPGGQPNPIQQLADLAVALSGDKVVPKCVSTTNEIMFRVMDGAAREFTAVDAAIEDIEHIEIEELSAKYGTGAIAAAEKFTLRADEHAIAVAMRNAERLFGSNLAKGFVRWQLAQRAIETADGHDFNDVLRECQVRSAALALVPQAVDRIFTRAAEEARSLMEQHRFTVLSLNEARASVYKQIFAQADHPVRLNMVPPANQNVSTTVGQEDITGKITSSEPLPRWAAHLLISKKDGKYPADLNKWEKRVFATEMSRDGALGWFRNSGAAANSLNIAYRKDSDTWGRLRPDFIFFHDVGGKIRASIVDPHSAHLSDALPKLTGLARFAEEYPDEFWRVESVIEDGDTFRVISLCDEATRKAVADATTAPGLYSSKVSYEYK